MAHDGGAEPMLVGADLEAAITRRPTLGPRIDEAAPAPTPRQTFDELFAAHVERLRRLARLLLLDAEESQEVVQEVFIKVHAVRGTPSEPIDWAPWLSRVTVNACRDRRRAGWWIRFRRHGESVDTLPLVAPDPSPEEAAASAETVRRVWREFDRLPRRQREVFVLRYVAGYAIDEISALLGVRDGSVKRHLFRAIRRLRGTVGAVR